MQAGIALSPDYHLNRATRQQVTCQFVSVVITRLVPDLTSLPRFHPHKSPLVHLSPSSYLSPSTTHPAAVNGPGKMSRKPQPAFASKSMFDVLSTDDVDFEESEDEVEVVAYVFVYLSLCSV